LLPRPAVTKEMAHPNDAIAVLGDDDAADQSNWVRRSMRPVEPNLDRATSKEGASNTFAEEKNPKPRQYKKRVPDKDSVQLFAFDSIEEHTRDYGGRPRRKIKSVPRFDSQSFDAKKNSCKTGHGFTCPNPSCYNTCPYNSKKCDKCSLACYYEAGVGVVILKEREECHKEVKEHGVTPKKRTREGWGRMKNEASNTDNANVKAKKKWRRKKVSLPRHTSNIGSYAMGGKSFRGAMGKQLLPQASEISYNDTDDDSHHYANEKTVAFKSSTVEGDGRVKSERNPRPVVALCGRRPFMIQEYPSVDAAHQDLGPFFKTIRDKCNYNEEHIQPKKYGKSKFVDYDFRKPNDTRTARRWARELLVLQHDDFNQYETLRDAREHPAWPLHLADAQYKMCMGRRILRFMRGDEEGKGVFRDSATQQQQRIQTGEKGGKSVRKLSPHHYSDETHECTSEDEDEDEAAAHAIIAAVRGDPSPSTATTTLATADQHFPKEASGLQTLAAHTLGSPPNEHMGHHLADDDLGNFGGHVQHESEDHDLNMINELNVDFPPEDHPPGIGPAPVTHHDGCHEDLAVKLQETTAALQAVTEEKEGIQAKYDSLFTNSTKTEEELRDTISKLMETLQEKEGGCGSGVTGMVSSDTKEVLKCKSKLTAASTGRDDLAKMIDNTKYVQSERDELARKLEEANSKLDVRGIIEHIEKQCVTKVLKEKEPLKPQHVDADSEISKLTEQIYTTSSKKFDVTKKIAIATSDLSEAYPRAMKLTQIESTNRSLSLQGDAANSRANELLAREKIHDGIVPSLTNDTEEFASSLEDCKRTIAQLQMGKIEAAKEVTSLQETIKELKDRIRTLSAELNASIHYLVTDSETTYKNTIANLDDSISKLTAEKDEMGAQIELAKSEASKLQATIEILIAERDAAESKVQELLSGGAHNEEIMAALNSEKEVLISKIEECIARLYSENDESSTPSSKKVIGSNKAESPTGLQTPYGQNGEGSSSPMEKLQKQLTGKEAEVSRLIRQKKKLEAYTKQTLLIFQKKFHATTQDYSAQLKEQTEKIQVLETELANHKREGEGKMNE